MKQIAVIGLGYVGLPLAIEFGKQFTTIGYDISESKIESYKKHIDPNGELDSQDFLSSSYFIPTTDIAMINEADFIIIAMPTPVNQHNVPDFTCLIDASALVGQHMKRGSVVIYESTVYPGATEEICVPVLEQHSGMTWLQDFNIGYSPERINPGDKERTVTKIKKIVAGDTQASLDAVAHLYESIITAGIYKAPSIRVAEAAKVIENIQRDVNIALMNELSMIFNKLGLDTNEVIDAASSKWNFVGYRPGLVGGHCIGVDPYYLISKAESVKYDAKLLKHARQVNNGMASFIVSEALKDKDPNTLTVAILGLTFKENCKDMRNSKVEDLVLEFTRSGIKKLYIHDPIADVHDVIKNYAVTGVSFEAIPQCDIVVLATPHRELLNLGENQILSKIKNNGTFVDVKGKMERTLFEEAKIKVWRM